MKMNFESNGVRIPSESTLKYPKYSDTLTFYPLRKHAYSNTQKISSKTENFQIKISDIFLISAQNIDCGYSLEMPRWCGSNEYPESMFWAEIKKK